MSLIQDQINRSNNFDEPRTGTTLQWRVLLQRILQSLLTSKSLPLKTSRATNKPQGATTSNYTYFS